MAAEDERDSGGIGGSDRSAGGSDAGGERGGSDRSAGDGAGRPEHETHLTAGTPGPAGTGEMTDAGADPDADLGRARADPGS